jgi:hypothetical protein
VIVITVVRAIISVTPMQGVRMGGVYAIPDMGIVMYPGIMGVKLILVILLAVVLLVAI